PMGDAFGAPGHRARHVIRGSYASKLTLAGYHQAAIERSRFDRGSFHIRLVAAVGGTFFMIPTWSEIPLALQLIESGFRGPAATLLVVLPAVSLPCLIVLRAALYRFR